MNVLIVDDYQSMRRMLADILRHAGFKSFYYAEDGEIALKRMREAPIDLVFLDWDMPNMTGLECLEKMREEPQWKDIPVVMVTAEAEKEQVMQAIKSGVSQYIVKPYTPQTVYKKIQDVLGVKLF